MTLFIVAVILSLDQLTKFIVTQILSLNHTQPVIKNIFHLTLVHNRGAAFGIFKNQVWLFVGTAIIAVILIFSSLKKAKNALYRISLSLILAGASGNLIDRLFFGYVIDFLDFRIWPVFNVADSSITVGAILLGYSVITEKYKKTKLLNL